MITIKQIRTACTFTLALSLTTVAVGQSYSIDWFTVDGGGGTSTAATYEVSGTTGQPDAGSSPELTGGAYSLAGGFWPVATLCTCLGDMNHDGARDGADVQ